MKSDLAATSRGGVSEDGPFEKPQHATYHAPPRFIVEVAWGHGRTHGDWGNFLFFCQNSTSLCFVCKDNAGCRGMTSRYGYTRDCHCYCYYLQVHKSISGVILLYSYLSL